MPKKLFNYRQIAENVWCTDSLRNWFIVKEKGIYTIRKGSILENDEFILGIKRFKTYLRLADAKTGMERFLDDKVKMIKKQEELFNELQKFNKQDEKQSTSLDYTKLDAEAEKLKAKWGIK